MQTQIIYVLISSDKDIYLEELWVSLYSLRIFHPDVTVKVLVDAPTGRRIKERPALNSMITDVIVVQTPEGYNAKQRSRYIKTNIRQIIKGAYLFIDTDTVICKPLSDIDKLKDGIYAVPECHLPISENPFSPLPNVKRIFDTDASDCTYWFNSGVMYVSDNEQTHEFYRQWNKNWTFSCFEKGDSQDQPALLKTNHDFGNYIQCLPDVYNCQVAMSLRYFADAAIVHWWHMDFIEDQSYSPYFSLSIYKELKKHNAITPEIDSIIRNCKQTFVSPTMPVGIDQIYFLFSSAGKTFNKIYKEGGAASWLMQKVAVWLNWLHKYTKKK